MRTIQLTQSTRQLFLMLSGFIVVGALLECEGLAHWADGLEIGPLRTVAVPATVAVQKTVQPLGIGGARQGALNNLARVGWSDDLALIAEMEAPATPTSRLGTLAAKTPPGAVPITTAKVDLPASPVRPAPGPSAVGAATPVVSDVPRSTELAPLPPVEAGKQRVVVLTGDSMMAVGLSAQLMREAAGDKNLHIVRAFRSGTGLARPEVFNWIDQYPAMLGTVKPDVVLVAIGANDGQGFVVDGKVLKCGSDDWIKVYQQRVADYLAMLEAGGARVVWVGLPPMKIPVYNEKIAMINRITYTVVSQSLQATWWNPASYVGDTSGAYREFITQNNGKTVRLRATDGIHLSDEGAGLMTPVLLRWLDPPAETTASPGQTAEVAAPQEVPLPHRRGRKAARR